jgi:hypothetical protein
MVGSALDIIIFAPLAPIFAVLLFWFIQLIFIESQKYQLSKISNKHEPLCRFTNLIGIFFQTLCHALGYTVTRSGISKFYISVDYGRVHPKKEKSGIFEWLSNGFLFIGPFFIPAFILLLCLFFLLNNGFILNIAEQYTFAENLAIFGNNLYHFSSNLFVFLFTIDLFHPAHLGFFILLMIFGLGIRPSYIGLKPVEKVDMLYDLKNIRYNILHKPLYVILLLLFCYTFFYLTVIFQLNWYISLFSILGWLSIISIVALLIGHTVILFIKITDEIPGPFRLLTYITMPLSYILIRIIFYFFPAPYVTTLSLIFMICITSIIIVFLLMKLTNKFKSSQSMKSMKKIPERMDDGTRRIIRK